MTRTRSTLILLLTITLGLLSVPTQAQDNADDAPYIYYYSPEESAFIIERADGADRRVLADFSLPYASEVRGDGWSPSGEWFAWTVTQHESPSPETLWPATVYFAHRDSGEAFTIDLAKHSEVLYHVTIEWSPISDILLAQVGFTENSEYINTSYIIDMTQPQDYVAISGYLRWSPQGNYLYTTSHSEEGEQTTIFNPSGELLETRPFSFGDQWLPNDEFATLRDRNILDIYNITTHQVDTFEFEHDIIGINWNPTGQFALVYLDYLRHNQLWLLSREDHQNVQLFDDVARYRAVPEEGLTIWSPSGNYAWIVLKDGNLRILEIPSLQIIDPPTQETIPIADIFYTPVHWLNFDGKDQLIYGGNERSTVFDVEENVVTTTLVDYPFNGVSDSGRYGVTISWCGREGEIVLSWCILDFTTGQSLSIPAHPDSIYHDVSSDRCIARWHYEEPWVFLGDAQIEYWVILRVVNADGSIQRIIDAKCANFDHSCFGWLPPPAN